MYVKFSALQPYAIFGKGEEWQKHSDRRAHHLGDDRMYSFRPDDIVWNPHGLDEYIAAYQHAYREHLEEENYTFQGREHAYAQLVAAGVSGFVASRELRHAEDEVREQQ